MGGGMGAVAWGEQTVPSGIAGVLIAMMPVWVAIFGRVFFGERLPWVASIGIAVGMAGVVILVAPSVAIDRSLDPAGVAALILSPIAWSAGSLFSTHRANLPDDPFVTTGMEFVTGASVLGLFSLASGELRTFQVEQRHARVGDRLRLPDRRRQLDCVHRVRVGPTPRTAAPDRDVRVRQPGVAVFLGWLILNESITPIQLAAGGVIVAGVALIIVARSRMPAVPRSAPSRGRDEVVEAESVAA